MQLDHDEHRLLYRISQAYYGDGKTQKQIAHRFGISRPKVSRLLQRARDVGIVNITLLPPVGGLADLEYALERRYALEEVVLVSVSDPDDPEAVATELGSAAADCLLRCLDEGDLLGLAWGRTILAAVKALPVYPVRGVSVVQLSGGLGPVAGVEHAAELVSRAAQKLGAQLRLLPAPGLVASRRAAEALRKDYQVSRILNLAARADVAVVGLDVP